MDLQWLFTAYRERSHTAHARITGRMERAFGCLHSVPQFSLLRVPLWVPTCLPAAEMRYVIRGLEIRSENAAKPASSAGRWMLDWIRKLPVSATGLDIGCGKLRYTVPLAKRISSVTAVDSAIQLSRQQTMFGTVSSVRAYASKALRNVTVCTLEDPTWRLKRYQIILCSNVLSAIPCRKTRKRLVKAAYLCLAPQGRLLLTTQYRNSHFDRWKSAQNAERYLDGFLVRGKRGLSFYGLLDAKALARLCRECGFRILQEGHVKELAYVLARRPNKRQPHTGE